MAMRFMMRSLLADFGIEVGTQVKGALEDSVDVFSDFSAARAFDFFAFYPLDEFDRFDYKINPSTSI
eukprot:5384305-Amphidinium_carterae.2